MKEITNSIPSYCRSSCNMTKVSQHNAFGVNFCYRGLSGWANTFGREGRDCYSKKTNSKAELESWQWSGVDKFLWKK